MSPRVLVALILVGIGSVVGLEQCKVDCSHGNEFTPDPMNCKNYYICFDLINHSEYPFDCDGSAFFDSVTYTCKDTGYVCTPECEKCSFSCDSPVLGKIASTFDCNVYYTCETATWTTCPPEKPYFNGDICQAVQQNCCTCKSYCSDDDVLNHYMVQDFYNCTNYYLCIDQGIQDETTHGHCPTGNFDPQNHQCADGGPCIAPCA